jgi:hypothetical protein
MTPPRRTYVVSVYEDEPVVVVESVQRDERARLEDLDALPERIREWEETRQAKDEPGLPG